MCRSKDLSLGDSFVLVALLGSAAPQPPAFLRPLLIPQGTQQVGSFQEIVQLLLWYPGNLHNSELSINN